MQPGQAGNVTVTQGSASWTGASGNTNGVTLNPYDWAVLNAATGQCVASSTTPAGWLGLPAANSGAGAGVYVLTPPVGTPGGNYVLEFYYEGQFAGTFAVAGTSPSAPAAPTFGGTAKGGSTLPVNTQALTANATGEAVQVGTDAAFGTVVQTVPVPTPGAPVTVAGLVSQTQYYVRLQMTGPSGTTNGPAAPLFFDTAGPQPLSASVDAAGRTLTLLWAEPSAPVQQGATPALTLTTTGDPVTLSGTATAGTATTAALSRPVLPGEILTLAGAAGGFTDSAPTGANGSGAFAGLAVTNSSTQKVRTSSMARASNLQGVYLAAEAANAPGTIVTPAKRVPNFELMTKPLIPNKPIKYAGSKATTGMQLGQEQADATWNAAADYALLTYILCSLLGDPGPPTALGGGAYQWTWNVSPVLPLPPPRTYSVDQGSVRGGERFGYGVFSGMTFKWSASEAALSGNAFGQQLQRDMAPQMLVVTNPAGVTEMPVVPIMPKAVGAWLSTDGGATFSRMQKDLDGTLRFNTMWKPVYHANDLNPSFDDVAEEMPDMGLTLTVEEGTEADTFMQRLYAGQMVYAGVKAVGPLIGAVAGVNINHLLRVNMPAYVSKPDPGDKGGVYGNAFTFDVGHDAAFGLVQVQLINRLPSL